MLSSDDEKLRRNLLKSGQLFEDPDFPATQSSVFYHQTPPFTFTWKRPKELTNYPVFLDDAILFNSHNFFDINPGKLGDRWLVSTIASLTLTKGLFYRVVPADQSFDPDNYCGLFRFRLWWHDEWKEVVIDDRLPTVNNKLVFIQSTKGDTFWASLLEKAYAKLHGSYEALKYGSTIEGLSDFTGGVAESISLREEPTSCSTLINKLLSMTSIVTAVVSNENTAITPINGSPVSSSYERLANGIYLATNYRVIEVQRLDHKESCPILIKLRNPLGTSSDYIGSWGKDSIEWSRLTNDERKTLSCDEGEFWMSYYDFMKIFTSLEVIHLDAETSKDEPTLRGKCPWCIKFWRGIWRKGVTAGGCRNHVQTFHTNPQLMITLNNPDTLVICLNQHSVLEPKVIGFSLYSCSNIGYTGETRLDKSFFKRNRSLHNSLYTNTKQISLRCQLEEGKFVLIPTSFEPGQEGQFSIRVYSIHSIKLSFLDSSPSLIKSPIIKAPPSFDLKFSQYETMFLQLADEHKTVNAFELQELLESCLPNDYVKSCATLEVCRQIIATLDTSSSYGRLKFTDYKNIMCSLRFWQAIFKNHTKGTSGILRADKLKEALHDVGFELNVEILSYLVLRYMRKDGTLRFGDFVHSILHLCIAFTLFDRKDPMKTGTIKMSLTEWIKACLLS
ncbi:calpain-C [Tetranychus urticae]|uniref:calpain-C n=1 Tax=Tetranychus urticae TaxID=32264 RepID=UPI00077BF7B4|nr:calpain-C [Tetranychus urticae]XP_025016339.1 calpain-C [Tetranychus urticae]